MFESFWKFSVKFCDTFLESETDYNKGNVCKAEYIIQTQKKEFDPTSSFVSLPLYHPRVKELKIGYKEKLGCIKT